MSQIPAPVIRCCCNNARPFYTTAAAPAVLAESAATPAMSVSAAVSPLERVFVVSRARTPAGRALVSGVVGAFSSFSAASAALRSAIASVRAEDKYDEPIPFATIARAAYERAFQHGGGGGAAAGADVARAQQLRAASAQLCDVGGHAAAAARFAFPPVISWHMRSSKPSLLGDGMAPVHLAWAERWTATDATITVTSETEAHYDEDGSFFVGHEPSHPDADTLPQDVITW